MRTRALAAALTAGALTIASCGGGGGGGLSEDEFRDLLNGICSDFTRDFDQVEQPAGFDDFAGVEAYAAGLLEVFQKAKADLAEVEAPDDQLDDFEDFQGLVDDEIDELEDLQKAAEDKDGEAISKIPPRIINIQEDAAKVADDLGVDECKPEEPEPTDTTEPIATDAVDTTAAEITTTVAETTPPTPPPTAAPTLPPVTVPVTLAPTVPLTTASPATLPPVTLPPGTAPPGTPAPTAPPALNFAIMDLPAEFNPPAGFTLQSMTTEAENGFIAIVASFPELNNNISEMGVARIVDGAGNVVATVVVGFARSAEIGMPNQWKNILCDPSVSGFHESPGGFLGIVCDGPPGTGIIQIWSITVKDIGVTIAHISPSVTLDQMIDGFMGVN